VIDQLLHQRNIIDQPDHPAAGIHISLEHDLGKVARDLVMNVVDLEVLALLPLDLQTLDAGILQDAFGVRSGRI
jgi:hypothetical protein